MRDTSSSIIYKSVNGVWLKRTVPAEYLKKEKLEMR